MRRLRREETGASLLLVMGLVLFVGLLAGATASLTAASIRSSQAIAETVDRANDVDAALKAAINAIRNSTVSANPCPTLSFPGPAGTAGRDLTVQCQVEASAPLLLTFRALSGGELRGAAQVQVGDPGPVPVAGNRAVVVLKWSVIR